MKFKLTNLRELSTEEQLHLNGGANSALCEVTSCPCSCSCEDTSDKHDYWELIGTDVYGEKQRAAMLEF